MPSIEAKGLTKRYGKTTALDAIDFTLKGNKIIGLIGRNGAGKTTLLNAITGRITITDGQLTVNEGSPFSQSTANLIGFARESSPYDEGKTLEQIISMAECFYNEWDSELCERLMIKFTLNKKKKLKKLSKGMQTLFSLLIVLCSGAKYILLDEPTEGLDAENRKHLYQLIIESMKVEDRMVIVSSHLLSEIEVLLEEILLVDEGRVIAHKDMDYIRECMVQLEGRTEDIELLVEGKRNYKISELSEKSTVAMLKVDLKDEEQAYCQNKRIRVTPVNAQDTCIYLPYIEGGEAYA